MYDAPLLFLPVWHKKFALIDMEYILKNIPAYEMTNEQLSQVSKKWQNEVEAIQQEAQNMYKTYQSDLVFLSAEMKTKREEEIVKKEQEDTGPETSVFRTGRRVVQEA